MRIPLYPHDLDSKGGFKRIAKKLQKSSQGDMPITLSKAREILADALGYQNYNAALRSLHNPFKPDNSDLAPAKRRLVDLMAKHLAQTPLSQSDLSAIIEALPWHALVTTWAEKPDYLPSPENPALNKTVPTRITAAHKSEAPKIEDPKVKPLTIRKRRKLSIHSTKDSL